MMVYKGENRNSIQELSNVELREEFASQDLSKHCMMTDLSDGGDVCSEQVCHGRQPLPLSRDCR